MPQKEKFEKKKDQTGTQTQLAPLFDEKSLKLLFVDSLMPIELIISFSSLSRWYEQKLENLCLQTYIYIYTQRIMFFYCFYILRFFITNEKKIP